MTVKNYSWSQLRTSKKALYIKNNSVFLWTLHENVGSTRIDLELRPAGQRGSITFLPSAALDAPGVARNFASGRITVSPDLEDEMLALEAGAQTTEKELLGKFQIDVEQDPTKRAIDAKEQHAELMARATRKRVQQSNTQNVVDEFINPAPVRSVDGQLLDPRTGEFIKEDASKDETGIKSVTVTAPRSISSN